MRVSASGECYNANRSSMAGKPALASSNITVRSVATELMLASCETTRR